MGKSTFALRFSNGEGKEMVISSVVDRPLRFLDHDLSEKRVRFFYNCNYSILLPGIYRCKFLFQYLLYNTCVSLYKKILFLWRAVSYRYCYNSVVTSAVGKLSQLSLFSCRQTTTNRLNLIHKLATKYFYLGCLPCCGETGYRPFSLSAICR